MTDKGHPEKAPQVKAKPLNIYQRLNEVRKAVDYLQKDASVQGYKAITHDAVTAAVRPEFVKHGILMVPTLIGGTVVQDTAMTTAKGIPIIRYEATFGITFINIDDPQDVVKVGAIPAHAIDQGDKAPGKALSYACKYALLKVLNIETGEDDEGRIAAKTRTDEETELKIIACNSKDELDKLWRSVPEDKRKGLAPVAKKRLNELKEASK